MRYRIEVYELTVSPQHRPDEKWMADCGNDHAVGATPAMAVDRLITYIRSKTKSKT